jgi:hypothetical protein
LSSFADFDWSRFAATGVMTVAKLRPLGSVRIVRVGRALLERLGHSLAGEEVEGQELNGMREAYARCARKASPCHEYLRFDFGAGDTLGFERLLVPFAETPNGPVSYVIGIAIYTGATADPGPRAASAMQDLAAPSFG